jgi:hypothetical protein
MVSPGIMYRLTVADFRERTRSYAFLVTMLGVLSFGYLVVTGKYTVQFGDYRTVYDSAWAGSLMAVCSSIMLALAGFYLVKGSIKRDRQTRVGQIVAATSIRAPAYLVSKFASNLAVLLLMSAALALVAFATLLFRNEAGTIDLWAFISPFLIITVPATVFVASLAVLFDTVRWLRGSAGNVIYLFVAEFCIVFGMLNAPMLDLAAATAFTESVRAAAANAFPGEQIGLIMGFVMFDPAAQIDAFRTFPWGGIQWTSQALLLRLAWIGFAALAAVIAIPFFDRFDPVKSKQWAEHRKVRRRRAKQESEKPRRTSGLSEAVLAFPLLRLVFVRVLVAEMRLALKGRHWFWYSVAIGLSVAQLAAPFDVARMYLTPAAMVWPLTVWSAMGTRERRYNTGPMLFSSPDPVRRQFAAVWISGVVVALAAVGCMTLRAVITGEVSYATTLILAAFLVPSVALAFGTLSGSKKLFEVLYLMVWYVGSIDQLAPLDLLGTTDAAITTGKLGILCLIMFASLWAAFSARRMQIMRG